MKVRHTKNSTYYVFTNFADSNNPLFMSLEEVENFKKRIEQQLSGLCEILAFSFHSDQYQLVVEMADRESFEAYYCRKLGRNVMPEEIPASTYIFSQAMANIQSGYAKWFNYRHRRFGSLFGRRFTKIWIKNREELEAWVERVNGRVRLWTFEDYWSYLKNFFQRLLDHGISSDKSYCLVKEEKGTSDIYLKLDNSLLRGRVFRPLNSS